MEIAIQCVQECLAGIYIFFLNVWLWVIKSCLMKLQYNNVQKMVHVHNLQKPFFTRAAWEPIKFTLTNCLSVRLT